MDKFFTQKTCDSCGGSPDDGSIMSIKESDMKSEYRNGDLVNVKHIGGCRIVKIEKQPDGTMCYLLKKGSKLFSANTSQMVAGR